MEIRHLEAFLLASVALMFVPGVDMALVTRQVLVHGRRAAFATLGGLLAGGLTQASFAAAGLSALLLTSAAAYTAVKLIGAVYLIALGVVTIWGSFRRPAGEEAASRSQPTAERTTPMALRRAFLLGFVSDVTNPKVAVFFLSFLPQFITPGSHAVTEIATLGLLFNAIASSWWILYVLLVDRASGWLRGPRVRATMERFTGAVLVALGIRLAVEKR